MRIFYDDSVEAITAAHPKTAVSKHLHIPSSISSVRDLFSISRLWRFAIAARWAPSPPPSMQFVRLLQRQLQLRSTAAAFLIIITIIHNHSMVDGTPFFLSFCSSKISQSQNTSMSVFELFNEWMGQVCFLYQDSVLPVECASAQSGSPRQDPCLTSKSKWDGEPDQVFQPNSLGCWALASLSPPRNSSGGQFVILWL